MAERLSIRQVAGALFVTLLVSYLFCIALGLLVDGAEMYKAWMPLLPGFVWPPTVDGFLIGFLWIIGYSLYGAVLWVVPYNLLGKRRPAAAAER